MVLMDPFCIRHNSFQIGLIFRQLFPVNGDFFYCILSMSFGISHYKSNYITIVVNLILCNDWVSLPSCQGSWRESKEPHAIWSFYVFCGNNFVYTRHSLCFFFMDCFNSSMKCHFRLYQYCVQRILRHL